MIRSMSATRLLTCEETRVDLGGEKRLTEADHDRLHEFASVYLGPSSKQKKRPMKMRNRAHKEVTATRKPTEKVVVNRLTGKRTTHNQWSF